MMKNILFSISLLVANITFAQFNFGTVQDIEKGTGFGYTTAVYGNTMMVNKNSTDQVKVYTKQADNFWQYTQTLAPSDKPANSTSKWDFGYSMAVNDSNAIITAVYKDTYAKDKGAAYFFRKGKDGLWKEEFVFENPSNGATSGGTYNYYAGKNIALYKNKATISHNNGYPGFVHILARNSNGTWAIQDTILRSEFGGIDGEKVHFTDSVFTSMFFDFDNQRVKEFRLQANGTWKDSQTLYPDEKGVDTYFGQKLEVKKNQMVVGAYYTPITRNDTVLKNAGKAYIYERVNKDWVFKQSLTAPISHNYDYFGSDVSFKGNDTLIIAADYYNNGVDVPKGALFFYKKENGIWNHKQTFYNKKTYSIGNNVFVSGNQVISFGYSNVFVLENIKDCQGVIGGSAKLNSCSICYNGTTGLDSLASEKKCKETAITHDVKENLNTVSPNPFSNELTVSIPSENAYAQLYDCFGKLIEANLKSGVYATQHLKAGIYILTVIEGNQKKQYKLIKN